jgi:hypothetical protein
MSIKELVQQAKNNESFECSYTKKQWLEKYAELIVQECIDAVTKTNVDRYARTTYDLSLVQMTKLDIVESIKNCLK